MTRQESQSEEEAAEVRDELRAYGSPLLPSGHEAGDRALQLGDEPQLAAWSRYAEEGLRSGGFSALALVFPQLSFPIRQGISASDGYRAATRRGIWPEDEEDATGLRLVRPDLVTLTIEPTLAGRIPIVVAGERKDFEDLVRAFSARNEPVEIPSSMGACLVRGLNNWDRVRTYRAEWETAHPLENWVDGFQELVPKKELYEDRFIILSSGPYSGVSGVDAGFPEESEWLSHSLSIRREHEATHYFTLRAAGTMRNNLVDELIADYVGLVRTFGSYREELALRFLGLEDFPRYREGGRLQNYRGAPPLSDGAFAGATRLTYETIRNFARLDAACPSTVRSGPGLAGLVLSLMTLTLEELATSDLASHLPRARTPIRGIVADRLSLEVNADRAGVDRVLAGFGEFATRFEIPAKTAADLFLVLDEILSNKVKYAWNTDGPHEIHVEIEIQDGVLQLAFSDDGEPFNPLAFDDPDVSQPISQKAIGGLGILLVKKLTDEQQYERASGLNHLWIRKRV